MFRTNKLRGPIPSEIGGLHSLEKLKLQMNSLSGSVPSHLSRCRNLDTISLNDNSLTGTFPTGFGLVSSLVRLEIQGNKLGGTNTRLDLRLAGMSSLQTFQRIVEGRSQKSPAHAVLYAISHNPR
jgi:hypothetical protein